MSSRASYRTDHSHSYLTVVLMMDEGRRAGGRVVDLSSRGCGAVFHSSEDPGVRTGEELMLEFATHLLPQPTFVRARVAHRQVDGTRLLIGFAFLDHGALSRRLPCVMLSSFNRRLAQRAEPGEHCMAELRPADGLVGKAAIARVEAVSSYGAGLFVLSGHDQVFEEHERVTVRFRLDENGREFRFPASVQCSRREADAWVIGVSFEFEATDEGQEQARELRSWVERALETQPEISPID